MKKIMIGSIVEFTFFNKQTNSLGKRVGKVTSFEYDFKTKDLWFEILVPKENSIEENYSMVDSKMITNVI